LAAAIFKFRFQKVLGAQKTKGRALEIEIGRIERNIARQQAMADQWKRTRRETLEEIRTARRCADMDHNASATAYLQHVREAIDECNRAITEFQQHKRQVQEQLKRTMRACQVLENYRDRQEREFMLEQERAFERVVDLHSLCKFMRAEEAS